MTARKKIGNRNVQKSIVGSRTRAWVAVITKVRNALSIHISNRAAVEQIAERGARQLDGGDLRIVDEPAGQSHQSFTAEERQLDRADDMGEARLQLRRRAAAESLCRGRRRKGYVEPELADELLAHGLRAVAQENPAPVEPCRDTGERQLGSAVAGHDDGGVAQTPDQIAGGERVLLVEPGKRLVEERDVRPVGQRHEEVEALPLAPGEQWI